MILLSLLAALQASPPAEVPNAAPVAAVPKKATPKLVCIEEVVTGARVPRRTCKTQEEWDDLRRNPDDRTSDMIRQVSTVNQ